MRTKQDGFANNFGLVGKTLRKYLATSALTATGLMAIASPALADNWTDHVADQGSIGIDTSIANETNITQYTDFAKVRGDADINAGHTVNLNQNSSSSRYVLFDTEGDATKILGNLNANGRVYIFDQDGIVFGGGSVVNVGSIVASTGTMSDEDLNNNKLVFTNVGAGGDIELNGTINVADAGIAAFVAPRVVNSGVINAKMGNVILASGNTVTLDMYGDGLVEVAVRGELGNALVENKGSIIAEGGNVNLTASAAKNVVENVINMDGVIDVSSVSMKGGKIILSGGSKGTVKVAGKLDASGTQGGKIDVKGANIQASETSEFLANAAQNGDGGTIDVIAQSQTDFRGSIMARGGEISGKGGNAEVSGYGVLGFSGYADLSAADGTLGTLLLDPTFAVIHSGIIDNPLGFNYIISAQALANSIKTTSIIIQADEFIDVGTKIGAYNTGNVLVDLALNTLVGTGDINLDKWSKTVFSFPSCILGCTTTGTTAGSVTFDTATLNINKNLKMGDGNVVIDANTVNLNGLLKTKTNAILGDARISSNANIVNVKSNIAKIQQGLWVSNDVGGAVINVAAGTYNESVTIDRDVTLNGANTGVNPNTGVRGAETIIDPNSPGFYVTADGATIDGFSITSADDGILVDGADNVRIKNNIIHDVTESGIEFVNSSNGEINNNRIDNTGDSAVLVTNGGNFTVEENYIGQDVASTIIGDGVKMNNVTGGTITRNRISNATQTVITDHASGIYLDNSRNFVVGGTTSADGNIIKNSDWDGIKIKSGSGHTIRWNDIDDSTRVGIYSEAANNMKIWNNGINDSNVMAGIGVLGGENISILLNSITDEADSTATSGIEMTLVTGGNNIIENNLIRQINGFGINVNNSTNAEINSNDVWDTRDDAITVRDTNGAISITENIVGKANGSSVVDGNGISLYRINEANIQRNQIYNTNTVESDHASGIYLKDSSNILVGGSTEDANFIRNADWDGVKIDGGSLNSVIANDIADSTRVGVYGVATNDLLVQGNLIRNSNTTAGVGIYYSRNVKIDNNDIAYSYDDGIHVEETNGNIRITNNTIDESADDGIEVVNSYAYTYIAGNTITNSGIGISGEVEYDEDDYFGSDGIHVRNVFENYEVPANVLEGDAGNGEYNIVIYDNSISDSADDGIEIIGSESYSIPSLSKSFYGPYGETGRVLVKNNDITNSGYGFDANFGGQDGTGADGIHITGIYEDSYASAGSVEQEGDGEPVFAGYAVEVIGNKNITNSGDDGIEVVDASSVLIDDNIIENSGLVPQDNGDDGEEEVIFTKISSEGDTGDYPWGADGIHVRNVRNYYGEIIVDDEEYYNERVSLVGEVDGPSFTPYSVVIRRNQVSNSLDDGIQALFSGDTLIDTNSVENSGSDINPRAFGGDGINVVAGVNPFDRKVMVFDGPYYPYIESVNVTVSNNTVTNSNDDGIEVVGSTNVVIDTNEVTTSGDDGINVLGFAGFYDELMEEEPVNGPIEGIGFAKVVSWLDGLISQQMLLETRLQILAMMVLNHAALMNSPFFSNTVTSSLANGLYVSGFNNGLSTVSDNTFTSNDIGAHFESGEVNLTGARNTFNGGRVGLRFAPYEFVGEGTGDEEIQPLVVSLPTSIYDMLFPYPFMTPSSGFAPLTLIDNDGGPSSPSFPIVPPTNYGGTIGTQTFNGQDQFYIELANGAFFEPGTPTWLNGLNSTYDGITPINDLDGTLDQASYDQIESRIFHFVDQGDLGLFFFGLRGPDVVNINQNIIFNRFNNFSGDITGLNVQITGLPTIPGGGTPVQDFNNINTFAGGDAGTNPNNLNNISTAAGGNENQNLNEIETQSGGSSELCWSSAVNNAGNGQITNVVYGGSLDDTLAQAQACAGTL